MRRKRREIDGGGLAFLDVISCGFGALLLLLVLTKVFDPIVLEDSIENLEGYLAKLQNEIFELRGETRQLNREMIRNEDQKSLEQKRLSQVEAKLEALTKKLADSKTSASVNDTIQNKLTSAKQKLDKEMKKLLAKFQKDIDNNTIGGIPVDSEYVIFIVDTSGSMRQFSWPLVIQKVQETLAVYPKLKGIQVMNDMGKFMFTQYTNEWIPDTQARRSAILDRLESWDTFSNSSPVEGITKAISTFYKADRKISLYVFGDEFSGRSVQSVITKVDRINRQGRDGQRLVRIHAIGFPVMFDQPARFQTTGIKFAILMRELCARNGGTFVALNDYRLL